MEKSTTSSQPPSVGTVGPSSLWSPLSVQVPALHRAWLTHCMLCFPGVLDATPQGVMAQDGVCAEVGTPSEASLASWTSQSNNSRVNNNICTFS